MPDTPFEIEYNQNHQQLTDLIESIDRPGNYVHSGEQVCPLPRVEIQGVGTLAFPLPDTQAKELATAAEQAPYGKGPETLYDTSVRNTKQINPASLSLSGRSWGKTLEHILHDVKEGLGCEKKTITAELYKLLLYEPGGFFAPHRDTEKAPGMFATLVITLPSFHEGGDLLVRHKEQEECISLVPQDVSEIRYAAFYADCMHEVKPVKSGYRLCLIYNLIHTPRRDEKLLTAPDYRSTINAVAEELAKWTKTPDSIPKIAWLLEHNYTPAGLSFAGLKNVDAARADMLKQAVEEIGYEIYLAIVHIEEYGPAEIQWTGGYHHQFDDDEEYEIYEISDWHHYISDWRSLGDSSVEFGQIPLAAGELLPKGALDDEEPDESRITEATGNAGAEFERAYHRAALVIWHRDRAIEVLLQAGIHAAVVHFGLMLHDIQLDNPTERKRLKQSALKIVDHWKTFSADDYYPSRETPTENPALMLSFLAQLDDHSLMKIFFKAIVIPHHTRDQNPLLAQSTSRLSPSSQQNLYTTLVQHHAKYHPGACMDLLNNLAKVNTSESVLITVATELIQAFPNKLKPKEDVLPEILAHFLQNLYSLDPASLPKQALEPIINHPFWYAPDTVLTPATILLHEQLGSKIEPEPFFEILWQRSAEYLLKRSEHPPTKPQDWKQKVTLKCRCADCRALIAFAINPDKKVDRFPMRKDRRLHIHQQIDGHDLDMTHKTERTGSPYTLVCKKTRKHFNRRKKQYRVDIDNMKHLLKHLPRGTQSTQQEIQAAIERANP